MALTALPPEGNTAWYGHYSAIDAAVRSGTDLYKPTVVDIQAAGTRDSTTVLHGDGAWRAPTVALPIVTVGTPSTPLTNASAARPTATVVYWLMANGVSPVNATGADLIWNAP